MTSNVLLLGRTRIDLVAAAAAVAPLRIEFHAGTGLDDVRDVMSREQVDVAIIGGGLPIEDRVAIVRHIYEVSDTTSVHLKDRASGPQGFLPFVRAVLRGLAADHPR
jgi:hypothetical protein